MSETATLSPRKLAEFVVEFGDTYNRTITINTLRLRVRGSWSLEALHKRAEGGRDVGSEMQAMPPHPGLRMQVIPRLKTAILFDPLEKDEALMARINSAAKKAMHAGPFKPVPRSEHKLNDDQFKSLLNDLRKLHEAKSLSVIEGELPTQEQIESLPGEMLYDTWYSGHAQPRFAKDVDEWMRAIEKRG